MKPVLLKKRKYTWKDIIMFLGILFVHYASFYALFLVIFGIHFSLNGHILPEGNIIYPAIWYGTIIGPAVNALLHVIYAEKGWPWFRFIMWTHVIIIVVLVPIATYI